MNTETSENENKKKWLEHERNILKYGLMYWWTPSLLWVKHNVTRLYWDVQQGRWLVKPEYNMF